jgi:hypothetical protein
MFPDARRALVMPWSHGLVQILVVSLVLGACSRADIPTGQIDQAQRPALQESWDIVLNVSNQGVPRMKLAAWHMERYDDPDSLFTFFEHNPQVAGDVVRATFFDTVGVESAVLTAESVRFDEESEHLIAVGDVRVISSSGRLLESETLHWDQAERTIEVPGSVYLQTEDETIRGFDLVADENLDTYVIRRITGTVVVREGEE